MSGKRRIAVIGGSEDGKTFLTMGLSRGFWRFEGFRSLVSDPFKGETVWGPQAKVFADFEAWRRVVTAVKPEQKFAAIWDEGTIGGRDRDNTSLVTAIRHNCDRFVFNGHGFAAMLPIMRGSLTDIVLAVQTPEEARSWASLMVDEAVMQATTLKQYEFLHKRKHHPVKILRYSAEQIKAGIIL